MELKYVSTGGGVAKILTFNRTAYGIEISVELEEVAFQNAF